MTKRLLLAGLLVSIAAAPAAAQFKAEEPKNKISGEMGKGEIFMDKRSPEDRDPCTSDRVISSEAGSSEIFMDKRSPEERSKCPDGVLKEGGGSDI